MVKAYLITSDQFDTIIKFNRDLIEKNLVEEYNPLDVVIEDILYLDQDISRYFG